MRKAAEEALAVLRSPDQAELVTVDFSEVFSFYGRLLEEVSSGQSEGRAPTVDSVLLSKATQDASDARMELVTRIRVELQ